MAQKTAVILVSQNDWDEWIEVIKTVAMSEDIWAYVDPDTPNPPPLKEPKTAIPIDVNPKEKTISALDEDEREELQELRRMQKRKLEQYDRRRKALRALRIRIQETISRTNLPLGW